MKGWKLFYLTVIIILLLALVTSIYYTLGGFDPVEVFVMEDKERTVIGIEYVEKYDFEAFDFRMRETRSAIDSGRLEGMLTVVFYRDEKLGKDSVHYFLGASVDQVNDVIRLPAGYDYREFKTDKVFKVFLSQNRLVRPLPEEIEQLIKLKAVEEGRELQPYSFELYYKDESLSVEHWAK